MRSKVIQKSLSDWNLEFSWDQIFDWQPCSGDQNSKISFLRVFISWIILQPQVRSGDWKSENNKKKF
jgi:hypothetical protein